jgi:ATP/maltotriose-dependent transcriptional regulator MalT
MIPRDRAGDAQRPNLVPRPHLIEHLNQGHQLGHRLTLVSAPAGFGKTTLVSEWVASKERPAAWTILPPVQQGQSRDGRRPHFAPVTAKDLVHV